MAEGHPDPGLLERFLRGDLPPAERRRVVRHLLTGCPQCTEVTRPLFALADDPREAAVERGPRALHPASYAAVFERVFTTGRRREAALAAEREEAPHSGARLLRLPAGRRLAAVERDPAFQTAALAELLAGRSRQAAPRDPGAAVELAELAAAVADRLDTRAYGTSVVRGERAHAWGCLGDARRLAGDLPGAERALALARSLLRGPAAEDRAERAELLGREASLAADRGRHAQAGRLLDRAAALWRAAGEAHRLGRTLIQKAAMVTCAERGPGAVPAAIELLREGIAQLDEHLDPRLLAYALHRQVELLVEADRADEVAPPLQRARLLYTRMGDSLNLLRLRVLQGRADQALGRPDAAAQALAESRAGLLAAGLGGEAALVSLELALLHARAGQAERVQPLLGDLFPLLRGRDLLPGTLFALLVLRRALERRHATVELLLETAGYLVRSRRRRLGAGLCWSS